jgi:superfamily I DNA/RNA helicase
MSLHKSKGLTSKVTIVSGCVQGLIPFVDSEAPHAEAQSIMREQRRLFYVAITPALKRSSFHLSLAYRANLHGKLAQK